MYNAHLEDNTTYCAYCGAVIYKYEQIWIDPDTGEIFCCKKCREKDEQKKKL